MLRLHLSADEAPCRLVKLHEGELLVSLLERLVLVDELQKLEHLTSGSDLFDNFLRHCNARHSSKTRRKYVMSSAGFDWALTLRDLCAQVVGNTC